VTTCSPRPTAEDPVCTAPPCSLASASGTTRMTPPASTSAMFCRRSAVESAASASSGVIGWSTFRVTVPLTRGSTMKVRPVKSAMARATASMSVFAKLSVRRCCACAAVASMKAARSAASQRAGPTFLLDICVISLLSFSGVYRQQHLVSRAHAEQPEQPVEGALHRRFRRRYPVESNPGTFHCALSLHLQRTRQGGEVYGGYSAGPLQPDPVGPQGHHRRERRLCVAPVDLYLAGERTAANPAVGPGNLQHAARTQRVERRARAGQDTGRETRTAPRDLDAIGCDGKRERRGEPGMRDAPGDALRRERIHRPFDAPGNERGLAAIADA